MDRLFTVVVLLIGAYLLETTQLCAQLVAANLPPGTNCSASGNDQPAGPEISIDEMSFSDSLQMPVLEQEAIAESVRKEIHGVSLQKVATEAREKIQDAWQDRGYFRAKATVKTKILTANPVNQSIALTVHMEEGLQYRLKDIRFQKEQAIRDFGTWRRMFTIKDGDVFNREKIDTGLESLRKAYAELGYMNFTGLAGFQLYDENALISVLIDVDEGRQFRVQKIRVLGLEDSAREDMLKSMSIRPGQIFNGKTWEDSVLKYAPPLPDCPCRQQQSMDERAGLVTLTLDFRPCSRD